MTEEVKKRKKRKKTKAKNPTGKPGRPSQAYPYEIAKQIVREQGILSYRDFMRWWDANQPARIPKNPFRTYRNSGWVSFAEFFGTTNQFPQKNLTYKPFHEARDIVRAMRIKTNVEYRKLYDEGKIPKTIPKNPQFAYGRSYRTGRLRRGGHWISWMDWLGANAAEQMVALNKRISVLLISKSPQFPNNVFIFTAIDGMESEIKEKIKEDDIKVGKAYFIERNYDWGGFLDMRFQNYFDIKGTYVIANINEVINEFDLNMSVFNWK